MTDTISHAERERIATQIDTNGCERCGTRFGAGMPYLIGQTKSGWVGRCLHPECNADFLPGSELNVGTTVDGSDPWTEADRDWFHANPARRWRLRTPIPGEVETLATDEHLAQQANPKIKIGDHARRALLRRAEGATIAIAVHQFKPGKRMRLPFEIIGHGPLEGYTDNAILALAPVLAEIARDQPAANWSEDEDQAAYQAQIRRRIEAMAKLVRPMQTSAAAQTVRADVQRGSGTVSPKSIAGNSMAVTTMTAEQLRQCVLSGGISVLKPGDDLSDAPSETVSRFCEMLGDAILAGRVFDLGVVPQLIASGEAKRGVLLYGDGHIGHPFRDPYVIRAEDGDGWHHILLAIPEPGSLPQNCTVQEFLPLLVDGKRAVACSDRVRISWEHDKVALDPTPGELRDHQRIIISRGHDPSDPEQLAGVVSAVTLVPLMTALLMLATDGVEVAKIEADAKLQQARRRAGKPDLPSFFRVQSEPYVTAISARGRHLPLGPGEQRHHASPIPHLRRGHVRHLPTGRTTWVRDALVNLRDPNAPLGRAFYQLEPS